MKDFPGSPMVKNLPVNAGATGPTNLLGKTHAGKDWMQKEKGMAEDKTVGWHHPLNGHEFERAPGDGEGQGSLVCCSLWGRTELDTTERLNNSK